MSSKPPFGRRSNLTALLSLAFLVVVVAAFVWIPILISWSGGCTGRYVPVEQPIPFSHAHHVSEIGIDCRFCHHDVLRTSFAGMPPTSTCINCHWQILRNAPVLKPVHVSWKTGQTIKWNKVFKLPGYVYFDHSIHPARGIGCSSCHGRIDRMRVTTQSDNLTMVWCLRCHRDPAAHVRPRNEIFNLTWQPSALSRERREQLVKHYRIRTKGLTDCYVCHR